MGVTINAANVELAALSRISADGQGYIGTAGPGAGQNPLFCSGGTGGGGGGYGGAGGQGGGGALGGSTYGSPFMPSDLGSGGGNNPAAGCTNSSTVNAGGGAIRLTVAGTLQLDGTITANGAPNLPSRLGGGAGGSVYVTAGTLTGSGSFSANGADTGGSTAGGGGGGRVAVCYANGANFSGVSASTADGGSGFTAGAHGSLVFCVLTPTPTVTPSPPPCIGDCNANGQVTIDELVTLVNIALENEQAAACPHGIGSGAAVDIALLIQAVNNALSGCGAG